MINGLDQPWSYNGYNCGKIYHNPNHGSDAVYSSDKCEEDNDGFICEKEERLVVDYFQHFVFISMFRFNLSFLKFKYESRSQIR